MYRVQFKKGTNESISQVFESACVLESKVSIIEENISQDRRREGGKGQKYDKNRDRRKFGVNRQKSLVNLVQINSLYMLTETEKKSDVT